MGSDLHRRRLELNRLVGAVAGSIELMDQALDALMSIVGEGAPANDLDPMNCVQRSSGFGEEPQDAVRRMAMRIRAAQIMKARRLRCGRFASAMFGEPAWEMLLALYAHDWTGARFTSATLANHIGQPSSTGARWIAFLALEELIVREDHPTDRRRVFISLSDKGRALLDAYFEDLDQVNGGA